MAAVVETLTPPAVDEAGFGVRAVAGEIRRALTLVEHAASKDEDRPILTVVALSAHRGHLYAVAADNYRIAEAHIAVVGDPDPLDGALLASSDRPAVLAWLKACGSEADVELRRDGSQLTFEYGRRQLTITLMDGPFPNYRHVMDTETLPRVVFSVNPAYLADVGKAFAGETIVQVLSDGPLSPVLLRRDDYREHIMPIRTAAVDDAPICSCGHRRVQAPDGRWVCTNPAHDPKA
jgi:DNA polymerase III sliding clamp (beta) subunit (PCNA family)